MNEEFNRAKEALLAYYSDVQISLGARLLGFGAALFALFEAYLNFNGIESGKGLFIMMFNSKAVYPFFPLIKGMLFISGVLFLVVYMVRTVFRYAAVSGFCTNVQMMEPFKVTSKMSVHRMICKKIYSKMLKDDKGKRAHVFLGFPFSWFLAGIREAVGKTLEDSRSENEKDNGKGWAVSFVVGAVITFALVVVLW